MDMKLAIRYGQLVRAAYEYAKPKVTVPTQLPQEFDFDNLNYKVISVISANDLFTDVNILSKVARVSIGLVLLSSQNDVVIAFRGTDGIFEWIHDVLFLQTKCPIAGGVGKTEDGFTAMYTSLEVGPACGAQKLVAGLPGLPWGVPTSDLQSLTICGHSLGSSLTTLLAYDVAINCAIPAFQNPTVYTLASPRTGDPQFALDYDAKVPNTFRITNVVDLVTHLPTELPIAQLPLYHHAGELHELEPFVDVPKYQELMQRTVTCHHVIESYLHLMYLEAGINPAFPLPKECVVSLGAAPKIPGAGTAVQV